MRTVGIIIKRSIIIIGRSRGRTRKKKREKKRKHNKLEKKMSDRNKGMHQ